MLKKIQVSINQLTNYCEKEGFKGWDPYDGLNSKVFQRTSFKNSPLFRWFWIQLFKRNPINVRKLLGVPKEYNSKGLALFIIGYCNLFEITGKDEYIQKIKYLSEKLIQSKSEGYSGSCWGYNFDWQIRDKYLFPKDTPTVVSTSFAVEALSRAYELTKNEIYKKELISASDFIVKDIKRTKYRNGFIFSYSPLEGNNLVYNASLLGSKTLCIIYSYTKKEEYLQLAKESIIACIEDQNEDGSWYYGATNYQKWIDSFHTGYNLTALQTYQEISKDYSFSENIKVGFDFYINNFFMEDGTPKYYHSKIYPIDIHCPGQLFVTVNKLHNYSAHKEIADKVMNWTIDNMQTKEGYFIYQKKNISSKIPYMRWSQAFMFYAMSYYLRAIEHK